MKNLGIAGAFLGALALAGAYLYPARSVLIPGGARRYFPPDLMQFYFAGQLAASGRIAQLYHRPAYEPLIRNLEARGERIINPAGALYFNRPAFAAWFCVPFAWMSYPTALWLAASANLVLLAFLVWKLPVWFPAPAGFRACLVAFVPFLQAMGLVQDALLLTLLAAAGIRLALKGRDAAAGVLLAFCLVKPHLFLAMPIVLLVERRRRMLGWFLGTAGALAAVSFLPVGAAGTREWLALLTAPSTDFRPELMGNVRGLGLRFGPVAAAAGTAAVAAAFLLVLRRAGFAEKMAAALMASLLLGPHTYLYDFSLLAVAALLAAQPVVRWLLLPPWPVLYSQDDALVIVGLVVVSMAVLARRSATMAPDRLDLSRAAQLFPTEQRNG